MTAENGEHTGFDPAVSRVGVLGGTGDLGRGLATRFAAAGVAVVIGSRDGAKAAQAAQAIQGEGAVTGATNLECAQSADIVVVAVPYDGHADLLRECRDALVGKIVVDVVNPLGFDGRGAYPLSVEEGSACEQAQELLPDSTVVGALHHVSAVLLLDPEAHSLDLDVLVLGDERSATDAVQKLVETLPGVTGVYGGRLRNAGQVEAFTANLISVNRRYKTHAGLRITRP